MATTSFSPFDYWMANTPGDEASAVDTAYRATGGSPNDSANFMNWWNQTQLPRLQKIEPWYNKSTGMMDIPNQVLSSNMNSDGFDWGELAGVVGPFLMAGLGSGLATGAFGGLGGGAGVGFAGSGAGLEAGALSGMPGFGTALNSSLGGVAAGAAGVLPDSSIFDFAGEIGSTADPIAMQELLGLQNLPAGVIQQVVQAVKSGGPLSSIANSLGISEGALSLLGKLGATALGALGSNQQAKSLNELATQYQNFGAPSRARYEAAMSPGFDPNTIPGYAGALDTTSKSLLAKLSASGGNPFGNPGGLIDANKQIVSGTALPAVQNYTSQNAAVGFGAPMGAALNLQTQGIGADSNVLNAIGYGLNSVTNPQPSLTELLKQFGGGFKWNTGDSL